MPATPFRGNVQVSRLLTALFVGLILLTASFKVVAQQTTSEEHVFQIESELLLEVLLDGISLDITVLAYQKDERFYVALAELMDAIRFPINTDPSNGQAGGWFIDEEREFMLDLTQGVVISGKNQYAVEDNAIIFDNQIFVSQSSLETWFPLRVEPFIRQLALNVRPLETIPLQQTLERRKNRIFGGGAVSREPVLPFQENPYKPLGSHSTDLRINTSSLLNDENDTTSLKGSYSLLSRGDLAWMTSTIAISGRDQDKVSNGRIKLERNLQRPFINLDYVELGDVDAGSRGVLVRGGGAERGTQGTFANEFVDLRGDIPPEWEVELYRNGILIDVQSVGSDAQYEFSEVPLEFGENRFEFIFYGPFGEERRDERVVFSGDGLDFGDVSYTFSAVEDGESVVDGFQASQKGTQGTGRYRASFNVGLGIDTTARFSFDSFELDGERLLDSSIGLSTSFSSVQASLGYNARERGLDSVTGQIRGRLLEDTRVSARYTEFLVGGLEADQVPENRILWLASANLSSTIVEYPVSFNVSRNEQQFGSGTSVNFGTTLPLRWTRISKSFFYQREESDTTTDEQSGGSFNFAFDHAPWRFRSGGAYKIAPSSEMTNVFGSAYIRLDDQMDLNFDVNHSPQTDYTNYRMGLTWGLDFLQVSPQVSYDSNERWIGLVSFSASFNPRPRRYTPAIDRLSQSGFGAVHARAFLDNNGDGVWNQNEKGLENVRFDAVQSYRSARTAEDGNAYLTRLRSDRVTDIAIDPGSLPGLDLNSSSPGVSVRPRPGSWSIVDYPVIRTMELEGYVFEASTVDQESVPARRVLVQLLDQEGKIVSQQRTVFDGFFLFSRVAPGTYDLVLKDELENRLIERPGKVNVTATGGVIRDLNFMIAAESRALMGYTGAKDSVDGENRSRPRIIAPVVPQEEIVTSEQLTENPVSIQAPVFPPGTSVGTLRSEQDSGRIIDGDRQEPPLTTHASAPDEQSTGGNWYVQFGAFGVEENATRRWSQLQAAEVLPASQTPRYESAGNLVRLMTAVGLSEEAARALCDRVRSNGAGDCLVKQLDN